MILLDTHVWWWSLTEPEKLSKKAITFIKQAKTDERFISSISIWEFALMVVKRRTGIELKISPAKWLSRALNETGIMVIELSSDIATDSCRLPGEFHEDPADRIIVATARLHNLTLLTKDQKILDYPNVKSVW